MKNHKQTKIQVSELFLVKCGKSWDRTFMASIKRDTDSNGRPVICGKMDVGGFRIWSLAVNEEELGNNLDALCYWVLKCGHQSIPEIISTKYEWDLFQN